MDKTCSKCGATKPVESFTRKKSGRDGYNAKCKECTRQASKKHYDQHTQYYKDKAAASRTSLLVKSQELIKKAKDVPCADCNNRFPAVAMDFHHVSGDKLANVGNMTSWGSSLPKLQAEIDKCVVLCACCHRIRHIRS